MRHPNLREEQKLWKKGYKRVVCLDEAGRGPLAGPVTAAAVMVRPAKLKIKNLKLKIILKEIKDSKKLSQKKREKMYKLITKNQNIKWGIGKVSEKVIDKINILEATKLAMKKALKNLENKLLFKRRLNIPCTSICVDKGNTKFLIDFLILDGNFKLNLPIPQKAIIKADEKVFSCAAASILAKVTRDKIMGKYHRKYPKYRFDKHKGYPTKEHLKLLKKYKPCPIHRKSFKPVIENL